MKIATWNLNRPKAGSWLLKPKIEATLRELDADVVVLTETNAAIDLGKEYHYIFSSALPAGIAFEGAIYHAKEHRICIASKYPVIKQHNTYNDKTAACVEIATPNGNLAIYGCIIGTLGKERGSFWNDLKGQMQDWQIISQSTPICIAGDFNLTFADDTYTNQSARQQINKVFNNLSIVNLTAQIPRNIDHIAVSHQVIQSQTIKTNIWNQDKKLSDHIGVCAELC